MKKFPPATDATPETLVRALARHGPSGPDRAKAQRTTDALRSPQASSGDRETPSTANQESQARRSRQLDSRSAEIDWTVAPERQEELRRAVVETNDAIRERRPLDLERFR